MKVKTKGKNKAVIYTIGLAYILILLMVLYIKLSFWATLVNPMSGCSFDTFLVDRLFC